MAYVNCLLHLEIFSEIRVMPVKLQRSSMNKPRIFPKSLN